MNWIILAIALVIGYIVGSVPPGYFYVKWATGQDIRNVESGRTGGTNSYRAAGMKVGLATGISDIVKGLLAVVIAVFLLKNHVSADLLPWIKTFAGVGSVVGHNYSMFLGFKGGAGTTPNMGWATGIWWPSIFITVPILFGLFYLSGMASVVSLSIGFLIPIIFGILYATGVHETPVYLLGGLITCFLVTYSLMPNIKRILSRNERIVGPRAKRMAKKAAQNK